VVQQNAMPIAVLLPGDQKAKIDEKAKALGYGSAECLVQAVIAFFSETIAPQSKFSFAPEGTKERVRVQNIVWSGSEAAGAAAVHDLRQLAPREDWRDIIRGLGKSLGLYDVSNSSCAFAIPTAMAGVQDFSRGTSDRFPGIVGGGDTRDDTHHPNMLSLEPE